MATFFLMDNKSYSQMLTGHQTTKTPGQELDLHMEDLIVATPGSSGEASELPLPSLCGMQSLPPVGTVSWGQTSGKKADSEGE